jgi:hypothetical protein
MALRPQPSALPNLETTAEPKVLTVAEFVAGLCPSIKSAPEIAKRTGQILQPPGPRTTPAVWDGR